MAIVPPRVTELADSGKGQADRPTLIVMAAGRGVRYGGAKQLEHVGPSGERLLEYAVFDARRAGCSRIVFVIREQLADDLAALCRMLPSDIEVDAVVQRDDDLPHGFEPPPGRTRPWGTVHAVLAARAHMMSSCVIVNADDFYGSAAYGAATDACAEATDAGHATIVALPLAATLSDHGPVVRAVCRTADGWLTSIEEIYDVERTADGVRGRSSSGEPRIMRGDELVSMNMWAFPAAIVAHLEERFAHFLKHRGRDCDAELPLPEAIGELMAAQAIRVRVREAPGPWFGLTHIEDRAHTMAGLQALAAQGAYPSPLWSHA